MFKGTLLRWYTFHYTLHNLAYPQTATQKSKATKFEYHIYQFNEDFSEELLSEQLNFMVIRRGVKERERPFIVHTAESVFDCIKVPLLPQLVPPVCWCCMWSWNVSHWPQCGAVQLLLAVWELSFSICIDLCYPLEVTVFPHQSGGYKLININIIYWKVAVVDRGW